MSSIIHTIGTTIVILSMTLLFSLNSVAQKQLFTVEISNITELGKPLRLAIFKADDNFPSGEPFTELSCIAKSKTCKLFTELIPGEFSIAVYLDKNENNQLDENMFGIPKEPYGFSKNFKPKFSAPNFDDCKIKTSAINNQITINLIN